jgi:hypothetical protein
VKMYNLLIPRLFNYDVSPAEVKALKEIEKL